ncbi:MAG: hypothetical protein ACFFDN_03545 [Candidatus Hodarchaeota archaeon]
MAVKIPLTPFEIGTSVPYRAVFMFSSIFRPIYAIAEPFGKHVGGVALDKTADVLLNINEITGGTYDPDTGQIVLYGKEDNSSTALPSIDIDDLAVAFHAVNLGTMPVVSFDPPIVSSPPEWPGKECFTVRYGPYYWNPDTGKMEILDVSSKTHFGWVMFEADRQMKCLCLGEDNRYGTPVSSNVPGYYNSLDLAFMYPYEGQKLTRFWFHPKEIVIAPSADSKSMELKKVEMQLSTETMWSSQGQVESTPDDEYFAQHFTEHYDEFANEQITYDDEGNPHYIFKELKQLAALVGIVLWIKENNIPMDLSFLENYKPRYFDSSPNYIPCTTIVDVQADGEWIKGIAIIGGVNYCSELDEEKESDPNWLAENALEARPKETSLAWEFNQNGEDYKATAISVDRKEKYGSFSHSDIDALFQVQGEFPLILARHFNSFNINPTIFGWGWQVQPYSLSFKGNREKFNFCTQQWEGYSDIWFHDHGSHNVYKFSPSGIYDSESDSLGIASRFNENEIILNI